MKTSKHNVPPPLSPLSVVRVDVVGWQLPKILTEAGDTSLCVCFDEYPALF